MTIVVKDTFNAVDAAFTLDGDSKTLTLPSGSEDYVALIGFAQFGQAGRTLTSAAFGASTLDQ